MGGVDERERGARVEMKGGRGWLESAGRRAIGEIMNRQSSKEQEHKGLDSDPHVSRSVSRDTSTTFQISSW